jgi:hypothetical protein
VDSDRSIASELQRIIKERTGPKAKGRVSKKFQLSNLNINIQKYFSRHINFEMDVREAGTQSTTSKVGVLKF